MKVGGQELPREHHLLAAYVTKAVNRLAAARLVYMDGAASAGDFPLSNADTFLPGAEVEVLAGAGSEQVTLFTGIVVKQSLKVRDHTAPQLVVECRHRAFRLTVGRRNAYFLDQTDGDIISGLLDGAGVTADVEATTVRHKEQVQYASTDWDFLLTRAQANGRLVLANGEGVEVKKPALSADAKVQLQFGATVLEMDAEMDARQQWAAVKSSTWDPAGQSVVEKDAADPGYSGPGNVPSGDLAEVAALGHLPLAHPSITDDEAQAWADAEWLRSRMNKTSGRIKCEGLGTVSPGDVVEVGGVGQRFGGSVFVTGVREEFDLVQGWKTHLQWGGTGEWLADDLRVSAPKAGALLPGVSGLQIGVVVSNEDPAGEHRVQVRMPMVSADAEGTWARVAAPDAGDGRGFFFRPEVGDEVVLGFLADDPRHAVVLGMLHSSARPAPLTGSDDNHEKTLTSRSGMKIYLDDDKKVLQLATPAGNTVTLSEEDKGITLEDQNGNRIEMTPDGIVIESAKALELKAGTEMKVESGTSLSAKGGTELKLEGSASAELSSSATTKVKGTLVQIN